MKFYFNASALHKNVFTCNYPQRTCIYILQVLMIPPPTCSYIQDIVSDGFGYH